MNARALFFLRWLSRMCLVALLGSACTRDPEREAGIVVAVYTDLELGRELARLTARVLDESGSARQQQSFELAPNEQDHFAVSFGVKRGRQDLMRMSLTGLDANGEVVIAQMLHARFEPDKVLLLRTLLSRRCYQQLACGTGESCEPSTGDCVPVTVLDDLPERGKAGDEVTSWLPDGYLPYSSDLPDAGMDASIEVPNADGSPGDAEPGDADSSGDAAPGDAAEGASVDACADPGCGPCAAMCSTGCVDLASDPLHCGTCEHACPYGVCSASSCVADTEGPRAMEGERLWEALHVYGFRIANTNPARLASLVALVSRPDPNVALRMALFEDRYDTPQGPPVAQSPALPLDTERVEWIIPIEERPRLFGGEKGYWLMFVLSHEAYLYVDNRVRGYWRGAASVPFEPIPEIPLELEFYPHELGLPLPNLFMTIVPEPAP